MTAPSTTDRAEFHGKRAVVVGLGASGQSAVRLLLSLGAHVIGTDSASFDPLPEGLRTLRDSGVELVLGGHEGVDLNAADWVVVSPGVPPRPEWEAAVRSGVRVVSETELAARCLRVPLCAIGGTNGKSTVTTLLGQMARAAGWRVFCGGNLGEPACDAAGQDLDLAILEVSSFQMERVETFRPRVAVLLGVSEDHLDRYATFADYVNAKGNCFVAQLAEDVAVVPAGDEVCRSQAQRGRGRLRTFGEGGDYDLVEDGVVERQSGERFLLTETDLHGRHNWLNAAAALAAGRALGIPPEALREGLTQFQPLPHRMTRAGCIAEVTFYDDSKATNVGAAVTALLGLREPRGVMILGGRDKLGSYDTLVQALAAKGRAAVVLGEARQRISQAVLGVVPVEQVESMEEAVRRAFALAVPGDAVLLSPACSSLDMYKNYAERGNRFIEAVLELKKSQKDLPK